MKPNRPICVDPKYCSGTVASPSDNGQVPLSAFRHATYGDTLDSFIGRNSYRVDGSQSVDLGLYKSFGLPQRTSVMIRLDCFNVFNSVRWSYPGNDIASASTWDKVTQTTYIQTASPSSAPAPLSPPRNFQLGVRFIY